jgi:hypothetical protein
MSLGEPTKPTCSQGSFIIESNTKDQIEQHSGMIQTLCLVSTNFMLHSLKPMSGPAKQYVDHNVRFYQLFGFSRRLGLYHALCATKWISPAKSSIESIKYHNVLPPTIKDGRVGKMRSSLRVVEDQFIVPDGLEEDDDTLESFDNLRHALLKSSTLIEHQDKVHDNLRLSIDARRLFRVSFLKNEFEGPEDLPSPEEHQSMAKYSKDVQSGIEERKNNGFEGLVTLYVSLAVLAYDMS